MTPIKLKITIAVVIIFIVGFFTVFTINEGESAFILRLGKIVSDAKTGDPFVQKPGLHFKIPFIDRLRFFDMRLQDLATTATNPLTVVTKEQTYLQVEYFAKW